MQIKTTQYHLSTEEAFQDTVTSFFTKERNGDISELDALIPNFQNNPNFQYLSISREEVDNIVNKSNKAMAFLYANLKKFMEEATDEDYHKLGIHNPLLIESIKLSWNLDKALRHKGVPESLFNGIYGNFDLTIIDGDVFFYEYNGNTPVLTYESIVLQDKFFNDKNEDGEQFNNLSETWIDFFSYVKSRVGPLRMVFAGHTDMINDTLTIETMVHAANVSGHYALLCDMRTDLFFDHMSNTFTLEDSDETIDYIFNLFPWEEYSDEALININKNYKNMMSRGKGTILSEPAYKIILSNKMFLAYVTENDYNGTIESGILPTFTDENVANIKSDMYVRKPIYGRMSANIEVYENKESSHKVADTGGDYQDELFINQPFAPLNKLSGENYQLRVWMAPVKEENSHEHLFSSCGLAVRKSSSDFSMDVETEVFIPHIIE